MMRNTWKSTNTRKESKASFITLVVLAIVLLLSSLGVNGQERKVTLSGFMDINGTVAAGDTADMTQTLRAMQLGGLGEDFNDPKDFSLNIPGVDLITTAQLSPNLSARVEIYFQGVQGGFDLNIYQITAQYELSEAFNLKLGQFLTPVGYLNTNQRFFGYLNYSYSIREMVNEANGYVPVTMLGVQAYGRVNMDRLTYGYKVGIGKTRSPLPELVSMDETFESWPGIAMTHEFKFASRGLDLSLGLSGYFTPQIRMVYSDSVGKTVRLGRDGSGAANIQEIGFTPYFICDHERFQLFAEFHTINFSETELGRADQVGIPGYTYSAVSAQLMFKLAIREKPFYPYVRYDRADLNDGGYYYALSREDGFQGLGVTRGFIADESVIMVGASYDVLPFNRIKFEYMFRDRGLGLQHTFNFGSSLAF